MSNQPAAAAPSAQTPTATVQRPNIVELANKLVTNLASEQKRIQQIADPTAKQAVFEISGTVLEFVREAVQQIAVMAHLQNENTQWSFNYMNTLGEHIEALEDRVDNLSQYDGETTVILPEDADVFDKVAKGCLYMATQLLKGPFPIGQRDEEGKKKLAELIAFSEQAVQIVADSAMSDEDEDEDEDDGDDGVDDDVAAGDGSAPN